MHSESSIPRIADDLFSKIEKKNLILSFQYIHMLVAIKSCPFSLVTSGLWHYGLWSDLVGSTKLERILLKNQYAQMKLLNNDI